MNDQLTLDVFLRTDKVLENFVTGQNHLLIQSLSENFRIETGFFIWGQKGVGKSHLLHAISCLAQQRFPDMAVAFLPLAAEENFPPEILQGLEACQLVCIDDLDSVLGDENWEQALFHLINRMKDAQSSLIVSANVPLAKLEIKLADLRTRLEQLLNFEVKVLDDNDRKLALQQQAYEKGIRLEAEVINYIALRGPRNMSDLMNFLDVVEKTSLKQKRAVTIPFLKQLVDW